MSHFGVHRRRDLTVPKSSETKVSKMPALVGTSEFITMPSGELQAPFTSLLDLSTEVCSALLSRTIKTDSFLANLHDRGQYRR